MSDSRAGCGVLFWENSKQVLTQGGGRASGLELQAGQNNWASRQGIKRLLIGGYLGQESTAAVGANPRISNEDMKHSLG